jgi:hypothetical protein
MLTMSLYNAALKLSTRWNNSTVVYRYSTLLVATANAAATADAGVIIAVATSIPQSTTWRKARCLQEIAQTFVLG